MASKLGGVEDDKIEPSKGQLVLVRNESHGMFGAAGGKYNPPGESSYVINRPFGTYPIPHNRVPLIAFHTRWGNGSRWELA